MVPAEHSRSPFPPGLEETAAEHQGETHPWETSPKCQREIDQQHEDRIVKISLRREHLQQKVAEGRLSNLQAQANVSEGGLEEIFLALT